MTLYPSKRSVILFTGDFSAGALKHMFIIQLYFYSVVQRVNGSGTFVCFVSVFLILVLESFVAQVANERHNGATYAWPGRTQCPLPRPNSLMGLLTATYAWPGEDAVPLATTQFPNPLITIAFFAVHDRLLRYLKWILH